MMDQALYSLNNSGWVWQEFFAGTLRDMGYIPYKADKNVFTKAEIKKNTCERYWSYTLVYVSSLLVVDEEASKPMKWIKKSYQLKGKTYSDPKHYLGGTIGAFILLDTIKTWSLLSDNYLPFK